MKIGINQHIHEGLRGMLNLSLPVVDYVVGLRDKLFKPSETLVHEISVPLNVHRRPR